MKRSAAKAAIRRACRGRDTKFRTRLDGSVAKNPKNLTTHRPSYPVVTRSSQPKCNRYRRQIQYITTFAVDNINLGYFTRSFQVCRSATLPRFHIVNFVNLSNLNV